MQQEKAGEGTKGGGGAAALPLLNWGVGISGMLLLDFGSTKGTSLKRDGSLTHIGLLLKYVDLPLIHVAYLPGPRKTNPGKIAMNEGSMCR